MTWNLTIHFCVQFFWALTQSGPIFHTKIAIFKSNFDQEAVRGRGQTQCLGALQDLQFKEIMAFCSPKFAQGQKKALKFSRKVKKSKNPRLDSNLHAFVYYNDALVLSATLAQIFRNCIFFISTLKFISFILVCLFFNVF